MHDSRPLQPPDPAPETLARSLAPVAGDGDDGIHIASVTRIERPEGAVLRATVVWMEGGRRVGVVLEVPEAPGPATPDPGTVEPDR